jgi:hypothetical protein
MRKTERGITPNYSEDGDWESHGSRPARGGKNQVNNPIYNSLKKYSEVNLSSEVKDHYNENFKTLKK